jgi:RNA polymerase sigma factor (sigma-70 family)
MYNPFKETIIPDVTDEDLVLQAQNGDWDALEQLIGRHQAWIFNIAVRMVRKPQEAEDITQEVLLKMLTKLGTFQGKSSFRTWLYRIVANHVLNLQQRPKELTFSELGTLIEQLPDQALPDPSEVSLPLSVLVEEAKVGCTLGMLLCLDPRQRLVFILGEVFGVSSEMGQNSWIFRPATFVKCLPVLGVICTIICMSGAASSTRRTRAGVHAKRAHSSSGAMLTRSVDALLRSALHKLPRLPQTVRRNSTISSNSSMPPSIESILFLPPLISVPGCVNSSIRQRSARSCC